MDKDKLLQEQVEDLLKEGLIMHKDVIDSLDKKYNEIKNFIEENKEVHKLSNEIRDAKHKESQLLWNDYSDYLRDITYNFRITGKQYHYIRSYVLNKRNYTEGDLFIGYKLKDDFFDMIPIDEIPKTNEMIENLEVTINEVTLIHHLIKDIVVTNLNDDKTRLFAAVIREIGNISKIFNKFNADSEKLSKDIYTWTVGLEPEERAKAIEELEKAKKESEEKGLVIDMEEES